MKKIIFEGNNWRCPECNDLRSYLDRICICGYDRNESDNVEDHYVEKASKIWDEKSFSYSCSNCGKHAGYSKSTCSYCDMPFLDIQETSTSDSYDAQSKYIALEFGEAIRICFKKYANISGRASRSEYWWWMLFGMLFGISIGILDIIFFGEYYGAFGEASGPFSMLGTLAFIIPGFTVYVRRLHDTNRSGWNQLWALTIIGIIPLFIWSFTEGDDGKNNYGENPLKKRKINKSPKSQKSNTKKLEKAIDVEKPKDKKEAPKTDADKISDELKKFKQMLSDGLISQADYNAKKKQIMGI